MWDFMLSWLTPSSLLALRLRQPHHRPLPLLQHKPSLTTDPPVEEETLPQPDLNVPSHNNNNPTPHQTTTQKKKKSVEEEEETGEGLETRAERIGEGRNANLVKWWWTCRSSPPAPCSFFRLTFLQLNLHLFLLKSGKFRLEDVRLRSLLLVDSGLNEDGGVADGGGGGVHERASLGREDAEIEQEQLTGDW